MHREGESRRKRQSVYYVLVFVTLAIAAGRIAVVTSKDGSTAFLSANDRSRWCTVASLVEQGTYSIDKQIEISDEIMRNRRPWQTIDRVRHYDPDDGLQHSYSSKPPLFPTLVAGVYKVFNLFTGMTLSEYPIYATRILLIMINLPLLALFLYGTIDSIDRVCRGEWTRRFAALSCCFGTMILPFSISLNNHLPAAAATAVALWIYVFAAERLDDSDGGESQHVPKWLWLVAGLGASFAAANELPALSMMVFWFLLFAMLDRASIMPFFAGAAIVAIGFFGTNWIAHESLRPAYAHRGNGDLIANLDSRTENAGVPMEQEIHDVLSNQGLINSNTNVLIKESDEDERWLVDANHQQFALLKTSSGWQLAHWDDWYEYPGSYWTGENRKGVDLGEPSRWIYFFHMTFGHHGLFSLTPIWLLVPLGLVTGLSFGPPDFRRLAFAVLVATLVCLFFYLARPEIDRNYGGVSACFRWMLWFAPLWLLMIAPVIERFAEKRERRIILVAMLALSVFSVSTALDTPWQSPWLYQFWVFLGWINP